jgi:myo-inositol-1(or 4)-monophosphatase
MHLPNELSLDFIKETRRIIQDVAAFILHERKTFSAEKIEHKGPNDLVSYVDRKSEIMLRTGLEALLPGSGFIGEEGGHHHDQAQWRWIVDPLDGTTNFIHGVPVYCVSVGLQYEGETLLGIIHDVPQDVAFWAVKGKGAFANETPIHVSPTSRLGDALLGTGFPTAIFDQADDYLSAIQTFLAQCHGVRRFGSAALDMAYVACGRLDGYFEIGLKPWDVAAGALLVTEAGGSVTAIQDQQDYLFGKQIVVSNGRLQQALLEVLRKHLFR